jgi:hypothetical protein
MKFLTEKIISYNFGVSSRWDIMHYSAESEELSLGFGISIVFRIRMFRGFPPKPERNSANNDIVTDRNFDEICV